MSIGSFAADTCIFESETIPGGAARDFWGVYVVADEEIVEAFADTADVLVVTMSGDEIA